MDLLNKNGYNLRNLGKINIILGKNGCGKSKALKQIDQALDNDEGINKYLTPERGGSLQHDSNLENSISRQQDNWLPTKLRNNQYNQFKEQSVLQYRKLEILTLREIEKNIAIRDDHSYSFDTVVDKINNLLSNVKLVRNNSDFHIELKNAEEKINSKEISSGESELVSLAIECLSFNKSSDPAETNILLIDEPDVHLHPDLQVKFALFLKDLVEENRFKVIIATHSTSFLGALNGYEHARFAFMVNGQTDFNFKTISESYKRILPIFGAHPLSNLFNESPIMLVEGEDDVRIWQQAIRTSENQLKLYPCSVDTIDNLSEYEDEVVAILNSVYDEATAYSLRDRDEVAVEEIDDKPPVIRFRLSCRNAENLILSDEVLNSLETNWDEIRNRIDTWIDVNDAHPKYAVMKSFQDEGYPRKTFQLKQIRNVLIGLTNSNKPWEIAVGQTIGNMKKKIIAIDNGENKLANFLGEKLVNALLN